MYCSVNTVQCSWDSVNVSAVLLPLSYVIIIIIILGISFMHGMYTYIPETNHVPREHRVATILM
jgi:hypothetical protein